LTNIHLDGNLYKVFGLKLLTGGNMRHVAFLALIVGLITFAFQGIAVLFGLPVWLFPPGLAGKLIWLVAGFDIIVSYCFVQLCSGEGPIK
jgi:hypothetical protein